MMNDKLNSLIMSHHRDLDTQFRRCYNKRDNKDVSRQCLYFPLIEYGILMCLFWRKLFSFPPG